MTLAVDYAVEDAGSGAPADPPEAAGFPAAARLRLPNGMTVVPQSRVEAEHFFDDIFRKRIYLRHGLALRPGDCVFDVGGNIGTFALFAAFHAPGARIFTFEPAPEVCRRLRANLALNGVRARVFEHGVADAERTAHFVFYPNSSGMSSFYADAAEEREVLRLMMERERPAAAPEMDTLLADADDLLDERFRAVEMECRLRPLSAVIREEGVRRIDFLKIDVQKAELEVLHGIDDEHWPLVRQIAMEVHDVDGRVAEVTRLLEARGFRVVVEQDEAVEGTILYNLFAVRPADAASSADEAAGETDGQWRLLLLSASSGEEVDAAAAALARHLAERPELSVADVAFTLRRTPAQPHRRAVLVRTGEDAGALLAARDEARTFDGRAQPGSPVFLFPGVGEQYPGMARGLYGAHPVFRREVDRCAELLAAHLGIDVRAELFPGGREVADEERGGGMALAKLLGRAPVSPAAERLSRTEVSQPVAFVVGYALARLWESWGIHPAAVAGHSLGEYTAACVAGVFSLEHALELVALRARAIQALPGGAMLAVPLPPAAVEAFRGDAVLAAVNAPELSVLAGTEEAVAEAARRLAGAGHATRRLAATHAFHSPLMRPAAEEVSRLAARMRLSPPRVPLVSNLTGTWLTDGDATDPGYWARHLVGTVRFDVGVATLLEQPGRVLVEMGPGGSLGTLVRQQAAAGGIPAPLAAASLPHDADDTSDSAFVLAALARLWTAGVEPSWDAVFGGDGAWVDLPRVDADASATSAPVAPDSPKQVDASAEDPAAGGVAAEFAAIWREVLGVDDRAAGDFFELGGHSLAAAKLILRVRERFGVEMRLRTIFQTRTRTGMLRWIEEQLDGAS